MKTAAPWTLIVAACCLAMGVGCAGKLTEARRGQQLASFDQVWETVRDKHYDPKLNGVDWAGVRDRLRPKMGKAKSDEQARDILNEMLAELKLSHYGVHAVAHAPSPTPAAGFVPPIAKDAPLERVKFGNLPEFPLRVHGEVMPDSNVAYFYVSMFIRPSRVNREFLETLEQARQKKAAGFVLDLRHNPGGIGGMAMGIGNAFVTEPDLKLGEMIQRDATLSFVLNPQAEPFTGPLAILIDGGSASTSEILAGGLQDLKRARVFGTRSAGMALPSVVETLPSGDIFQYAVANYISTGGRALEGTGVTPDEVVAYPAPYDEPDPVLKAAVTWIKQQEKRP